MDFKRNPLLLLSIGLLAGIVVAESVYCITAPLIVPDGSVAIVTDRDYYPKVSSVLSGARQSIHMVMFSANHQTDPKYKDSHVNELLEDLIAAHNRGIDVRMVMDEWPEGNNKTRDYLVRNNVPARVLSTPGATTHAKLIIVDGRVVVVGSTNWAYTSIDKNHEANVIISDGGIAGEFEAYFQSVYQSAEGQAS